MKQYPADRIRNVGLFSHGGAGKTSLTEALLFDTKAISRLGRVEDGTTVSDFDPDEVKRHISVSTAVAPVEWRDHKINVLDAPGYADFLGEVQSALRVVDAAVILLDASAGVEVGTEQAWRLAEERGLPRILFINKMDRENADFNRALDSAREAFGKAVAPIQFPIGSEKRFKGFVSLLDEHALVFHDNHDGGFESGPVPDDLHDTCDTYRRQLVEAIAEHDEELMVRYLEDDPISNEELIHGLKECVRDGTVIPVLCGAATSNRGVPPLLDAIVDYLPSAAEVAETPANNGAAEPKTLVPDPDAPLAAFAFKTLADAHVGRVTYFRVFSGTFKGNAHVANASKQKPERVGQLFFVRGKEHINTDAVGPGDIAAVGKLATVATGDTIADEHHPVTLMGVSFPGVSYAAAVNPKTKADLDKMGQALHRLAEEDPTLQISRDPQTGEMIVAGLGEPHVQIALDRMSRRFNVNVDLGLPRVAYRETITAKTLSEYKHKKQTGGAGKYGHVFLELEPLPDADFEFAEKVVGGSVPRNFYPAVEKGVREGLESGPLGGYPVVNLKVTLTDGSYHDVDSNEMAFKIASKEAFKKGVLQAKPVLLEPVLEIHVTVPEHYMGDVMSDLNGKRAHVNGMTPGTNGTTTVDATDPAAEVQRYATDLRSITQGRGSFTTAFSHYQPVPSHLAEQIKAAAAKLQEHAHH
ncbi:MAG: Elongation factor G-like protein TM_1651 [uncultured Thermomicrobiales bacterium]|uniref:Elongation factor G n=1 Tax=uncultured Thermomicrobiales bacterium TaxID=1645740 RepID=A0A6J4UN91_9BACT|nr:MAG: Elongation factor G-like protein TM_1651 [uncultured Thermomicrobiales bacterium]